jgi:hypothetical protein
MLAEADLKWIFRNSIFRYLPCTLESRPGQNCPTVNIETVSKSFCESEHMDVEANGACQVRAEKNSGMTSLVKTQDE